MFLPVIFNTQCYITCVVTCVIMQRNGAELHTASSCYWDNTSDGMFIIPQYCVTMCTSCVMWYVHWLCNVVCSILCYYVYWFCSLVVDYTSVLCYYVY